MQEGKCKQHFMMQLFQILPALSIMCSNGQNILFCITKAMNVMDILLL
jgi:hypothetical protein